MKQKESKKRDSAHTLEFSTLHASSWGYLAYTGFMWVRLVLASSTCSQAVCLELDGLLTSS